MFTHKYNIKYAAKSAYLSKQIRINFKLNELSLHTILCTYNDFSNRRPYSHRIYI